MKLLNKHCLLFLLPFLLSITLLASGSFKDTSGHLFEDEINLQLQNNLVSGYQDATFRPDNSISRAEALKVLLENKFEVEVIDDFENEFSDVQELDWFFKYIQHASKHQIVNGYQDGSFRPNSPISIAESLKILFKVFEIEVIEDSNKTWFENLDRKAKSLNLFAKSPNSFLDVNKNITRAEFVYLYSALDTPNSPETITNWLYESEAGLQVRTLKSKNWFKLENGGILVLFSDGVFSLELINNDFQEIEDSLEGFNPLDRNYIVSPIFYNNHSIAFRNRDSYYEQSLSADLNKIIRISMQKTNNLELLINNLDINLDNLEAYVPENILRNQILNNLLVEGFSENFLNKLSNKQVIHTDVIGIGMGPIDYIYLADLNLTIKNERNTSTIMQFKDGNDYSF